MAMCPEQLFPGLDESIQQCWLTAAWAMATEQSILSVRFGRSNFKQTPAMTLRQRIHVWARPLSWTDGFKMEQPLVELCFDRNRQRVEPLVD